MADDTSGNPLSNLLGRLGLPADQLAAVQSQLGRAFLPTEQLQMMRDLLTTFSPSMDQLAAVRAGLDAQRVQLEAMLGQLDEMEATLERLSGTAEQLLAMQEPVQRFVRLLGGDDRSRRDG